MTTDAPRLVAVLDMGASAIRLVIAEIGQDATFRVIEEASRSVWLGRDTFASGVIRSRTAEAALHALDGFRRVIDGYGTPEIRAVATSAVREARNRDAFLDRVHTHTGIQFQVINEAEESRLAFLAFHYSPEAGDVGEREWTLLVEVGGGSSSLTLLRHGEPNRSGVYALGAIRLRQQLELWKHPHDLQVTLLKRQIANVVNEIKLDIPLSRISHVVAMGGDVRFAAAQIGDEAVVTREAFFDFCDQTARLDVDGLVETYRLGAAEADTVVPSLLVYRTLLADTSASELVISDATLRVGLLIDMAGRRLSSADFDTQVLTSAEAVGHKYRFDAPHGRHVGFLAGRLFDGLAEEHGLGPRERLLLQVAALLHDIGIYVSLRAHHKHTYYLLAASQIFGLSDEETAVVANVARYHRRATPQRSHVPFIALDRQDRVVVTKLAAILRVANALDAEHLQKVRDLRVIESDGEWLIEYVAAGDTTMEQVAATARAAMLSDVFGRQVVVRSGGTAS